jgi:hypothetical protein
MCLEHAGITLDYNNNQIKIGEKKMKFKKLNHLLEFEINSKTSYIKQNYNWFKNDDGFVIQVTDNKEIEKLNLAQDEYNKRLIK